MGRIADQRDVHLAMSGDRLEQAGGRARVFRQDGFTFDAGPTIVTAPFLFEELWALAGERFSNAPPERGTPRAMDFRTTLRRGADGAMLVQIGGMSVCHGIHFSPSRISSTFAVVSFSW